VVRNTFDNIICALLFSLSAYTSVILQAVLYLYYDICTGCCSSSVVEMFFSFLRETELCARSRYRNIANSQSYKNSIRSPASRVILYNAGERTRNTTILIARRFYSLCVLRELCKFAELGLVPWSRVSIYIRFVTTTMPPPYLLLLHCVQHYFACNSCTTVYKMYEEAGEYVNFIPYSFYVARLTGLIR
jgi:hypothetical protein